jgi:chromosome segregation ATPase
VERLEAENRAKTEELERAWGEAAALRESQNNDDDPRARAEELEAELRGKNEELERVAAELAALRDKTGELETKAASYEHLKNRAADIEFGAHERAEIILEEAHNAGKQIREEGVQWVRTLQNDYDAVRDDMECNLRQANREMENITRQMRNLSLTFDKQGELLSSFIISAEDANNEQLTLDN